MLSKNKKLFLTILYCFSAFLVAKAQTFIDKNAQINIFSSTPVEDIKAVSHVGVSVLQLPKQEIAFQLMIKALDFDKKLMQQHFNEDYMESDKYPVAKFKGIIEPKIDLTKDGEYDVVAKGILTVHGVEQARNINGKITIKNGAISLFSTFEIACVAHRIKIPSLVITKIAEIIQVKIKSSLTSLNK